MKVLAVFLLAIAVVAAVREDSLSVLDTLRRVQTSYRELQKFVVSSVAEAKHNSSSTVYDVHSAVLAAKESFLQKAVNQESVVVKQINGQSSDVDRSCLDLLRTNVESNMNLAGVTFSTCISKVDNRVNTEVQRVLTLLAVNESSYANVSLFNDFAGRNIFMNPQAINTLLQVKLQQLQELPVGLPLELSAFVDDFRARLTIVQAEYTQCLVRGDQLLQKALDLSLEHLLETCSGEVVPEVDQTTVATEDHSTTVWE